MYIGSGICRKHFAMRCVIGLLMGLFRVSYSVEQITGELKLNGSDLTFVNSRLPRCDDWGKIDLLSYYYLKIDCSGNKDCQTSLSPAEKIELHRMCSMKEECTSSTFYSVDSVDPISYKLVVHYQCLDHFVTFVDICTNTTKTDDKDMHLISSDSLRDTKRCQCTIKGGGFSFLLNDIRLTSTNPGRHCSPINLQILSFDYTCKSEAGVFNTQLNAPSAVANISLKSTTRDILPEMIWITVQPKEIFTITCESINWETRENPTTVEYTTTPANSTDSDSNSAGRKTVLIGIAIGVVFAAAVFIGVVVFICKKRKRRQPKLKKRTQRKKKTNKNKHIVIYKNQSTLKEKEIEKPKPIVKRNMYSDTERLPQTWDKVLDNENTPMHMSDIGGMS